MRKALFMTINRDAIVKGIRAQRLDAMRAEYQLGCDYSLLPSKHDPAGEKKLLAEAGYPKFDCEIAVGFKEKGRSMRPFCTMSKVRPIRSAPIDLLQFLPVWRDCLG